MLFLQFWRTVMYPYPTLLATSYDPFCSRTTYVAIGNERLSQ